ncbi:MAG: hypothetical protein JO237_07145 [Pseudolabrys sp.]|nr:hypothetical protein [Pseudolabrys sp.]
MCLDVLRAMSRDSDAAQDVLADLVQETKGLPGATDVVRDITAIVKSSDTERHARLVVDRLAVLAALAALARSTPHFVVEHFARSYLGPRGTTYGSVAIEEPDKLLQRALPA